MYLINSDKLSFSFSVFGDSTNEPFGKNHEACVTGAVSWLFFSLEAHANHRINNCARLEALMITIPSGSTTDGITPRL